MFRPEDPSLEEADTLVVAGGLFRPRSFAEFVASRSSSGFRSLSFMTTL